MENQFQRTQILIGQQAIEKLQNSRVAVFGVGGVGGYVCEALVRSGLGAIDIIDSDTVAFSNLNRQIIATHNSIGKLKVDVMEERIKSINPNCQVNKYACFYLPETESMFDFTQYDYVVDAVDTVSAKISLVMKCKEVNTPIICSMGAGNKLKPNMFEVSDIYKTEMDPLAKVMRHEMKKRGVKKLKVVYSKEKPLTPLEAIPVDEGSSRRSIPGSNAYVPASAGLLIASEVINDLIK